MDKIPDLDWANLNLDWEVPTHSYTTDQMRRMTGEQRLEIAFKLSDEGRRRCREALWRKFPDATPQQMREIIIRIRLAESEQEKLIAACCAASGTRRRDGEC